MLMLVSKRLLRIVPLLSAIVLLSGCGEQNDGLPQENPPLPTENPAVPGGTSDETTTPMTEELLEGTSEETEQSSPTGIEGQPSSSPNEEDQSATDQNSLGSRYDQQSTGNSTKETELTSSLLDWPDSESTASQQEFSDALPSSNTEQGIAGELQSTSSGDRYQNVDPAPADEVSVE